MKKFVQNLFFVLVCLSLLAPLWVFKDLLFPYVTSKAFYFRILIEAALPFYIYLLVAVPKLRPKWRKNPLNWLMLAFLALNLISAFVGVDVVRSLWGNFERMGGVFYLGNLTLLYFYTVALGEMGSSYLKWFLHFFLAVALVVTVNGIFGKLGWPILVMDPSLPARVSSTLGNPIYLGSYLVVPLFLALYFGKQAEKKVIEWLYYFCAFLFLVGILLSGTRGATVGLVGGGFLAGLTYVFFTPNKKIKLYGGVAAVLFFAAYAFLSAFNSHLPQGSDLKRLFDLKDSNTQARIIQWGVALKGYKDHPLLGVGDENYYIIGNKYYNPAIFQYDKSWFDKPHNYLLEILVTDGIFGLLAYLGILFFVLYAFYRGYKAELLTLFEFCVLTAGLLVYQIQNLTVFDTVPASLAFYAFMGFAGYIWVAAQDAAAKEKPQNKKSYNNANIALPAAAAIIAFVVVAYIIYAANIVPMEIAKAVNYGAAYSSVDPAMADTYFQRALSLPFNFDKTETANKYADFAGNLSRTATPANQALANKINAESITALNDALATEPYYAITWESLAQVYLFKGVQNGQLVSLDPGAEDAINHAITLAPKREEAYLTLAQIKAAQGDIPGAESVLNGLIQEFPTDPGAKAQLANLYRVENQQDKAVSLMEQAEAEGYTFSSYSQMQWLVAYYEEHHEFDKAIALQQEAEKVEPDNIQVFEDLALLYANAGQTQNAISLAEGIIQAASSTTPQMQALIDSLQKQASSTPKQVK